MMLIDIDQIPEEGLKLEFQEPPTILEFEDQGVRISGLVSIFCHVQKYRSTVFVRGRIFTVLEMECGRCLETFPYRLESELEVDYQPAPAQEESEEEVVLEDKELLTMYYTGREINLTEAVRDQIALEIPIQPIFSEQCRGLCPTCGTNLNIASCHCAIEKVDPRWEALKSLRRDLRK
ncbi:MAG: DUF177 domain-containing protein [Candidatus Tectomicrobia bacterium]|nr:DUF177 domain-containing protein [Candidatus Tectomicrobia bacterium]